MPPLANVPADRSEWQDRSFSETNKNDVGDNPAPDKAPYQTSGFIIAGSDGWGWADYTADIDITHIYSLVHISFFLW